MTKRSLHKLGSSYVVAKGFFSWVSLNFLLKIKIPSK